MGCESALQVGEIYFFLKYIGNFKLGVKNVCLNCFTVRGVNFLVI